MLVGYTIYRIRPHLLQPSGGGRESTEAQIGSPWSGMYRPEWRGGGALWDLIRRAVCAVLSRRGCLLSSIYPAVGGKAATETSATGESSYRNECATGESSYRKACCRASLAIDCCHAEHTRSGSRFW